MGKYNSIISFIVYCLTRSLPKLLSNVGFGFIYAVIVTHGYRDGDDALWQVDVDLMDVLFTSFVEYLQLENAYNIFILNLKRDAKRARYGYRCVNFLTTF